MNLPAITSVVMPVPASTGFPNANSGVMSTSFGSSALSLPPVKG